MPWWLWALFSALAAGATNVLVAAGLKELDSHVATAVRALLVLPIVWLGALLLGRTASLSEWTSRHWLWLALSALTTGLSWLCGYRALALVGASRSGPIDKSSLVFTVLLATLFLGERPSPRLVIAVAMVTLGAILSVWR